MAQGAAAYKQLQPLQTGISQDLQFWAQEKGARRREGLAEAQLAASKAAKEAERRDRLYDKYVKPINPYDTKSQSLNEAVMRVIVSAQEKVPELLQIVENPSASQNEKIRARINLDKINNLPDRLKLTTDYYTEQMSMYDEAVKAGKWWVNEDFEKWRKKGFAGIEFGLDKNFDPVVAMRDVDGDGVLDVQDFDTIREGTPQWDFLPKINEEAIAMALAEKISEVDDTTQKGFTTTQTVGADKEAIQLNVNRLYFDDNGEPTKALKSSLKRDGLPYSAANAQKMVDKMTELTLSYTDRKKSEKTDFTAQRLAAEQGATGDTGDGKNVKFSALQGTDGQTYTNAEVLEAKRVNGKLVLEISYPKTKSITKNDYSELQKAAEAGDENAKQQLALARITNKGGAKVTIPGQNARATVTVRDEDLNWVSQDLGIKIDDIPAETPKAGGGMNDDEFNQFMLELDQELEDKLRTRQ